MTETHPPRATALMQGIEKRDADMRSKMFETMLEAFFKRWAPSRIDDTYQDGQLPDKYEDAQFHAELHMLIRQVYTDAQAPLLKQLVDMVKVMPMFPQRVLPEGAGRLSEDTKK